jgi:hypothetical protein
MARVQPVFKPLLKPHLEDMEKKVAPGMFILTWASMNIDGYLHRFKQVCCKVLLGRPAWLAWRLCTQCRYTCTASLVFHYF